MFLQSGASRVAAGGLLDGHTGARRPKRSETTASTKNGEEQDLGDTRGAGHDSEEAERAGHDGDDEKYSGPGRAAWSASYDVGWVRLKAQRTPVGRPSFADVDGVRASGEASTASQPAVHPAALPRPSEIP